jgi:MoaA/NifB/PqqE/SkfB family radical SAM enzyme
MSMSTNLGIPTVQPATDIGVAGAVGIQFSTKGHYFKTTMADADLAAAAESIDRPLSVIYQVTRRCNFDCNFCSETMQLKDPTLEQIASIQRNLAGVPRVFLSGGEPLLRRDFVEIVDIFKDHIVAVPTNATRGHLMAPKLAGKVSFINVGLEGPRNTTNRVRGDYDKVMRGIMAFRQAGLPLSISAVVLRSLLPSLAFTYQIADILEAGKVKLIHPIRKGNGLHLDDSEFLTLEESGELFSSLEAMANEHGWTPGLRMTTWTRETEGYSILVYPDGSTWSWPVYGGLAERGEQGGTEDKVAYLGDLKEEPITEIWKRYTFKLNHLRKYLGKSISVSENGSGVIIDARHKQSAMA